MKPQVWTRSAALKEAPASLSPALPLIVSYVLALATPLFVRAIQAAPGLGPQHHGLPAWVPTVMALGVGLAGSAALVWVMKQLVESMDKAPYATLSAALSVLLGILLMGLNATLHIGLLDANALAFVCLTVSVLGGAITVRCHGLHAVWSLILCTFPADVVLFSVWAQSGFATDFARALHALGAADQAYLAVLSLACVLLSIVALLVRTLATGGRRSITLRALRKANDSSAISLIPPHIEPYALPLLTPSDRERISVAMLLAISDLDKRDLPFTPPNFSVWTYHDSTAAETPWEVLDAIEYAELCRHNPALEADPELIAPLTSRAMLGWSVLIAAGVLLASGWVLTQGIMDTPSVRAPQKAREDLLTQGVRAQSYEP